jgi:hypothetical protein
VENAVSSSRRHISPSFRLLPRPAEPCIYFFEISKLENVGRKLVEIALGKHKFPNFFVKKGKFCQKQNTAAYCRDSLPGYGAVRFATVFVFSIF